MSVHCSIALWLIEFIRDENGGSGSAGLLHGIGDIGEDGKVKVKRAGLLGVGTTDDVGAYVV